MTNALALCLLVSLFCCSSLTWARQVPKECSKGPGLWCQSLRQAADCGAVGHCVSTVWAVQEEPLRKNDVTEKFVTLFSELKDINDLINEEYLGQRVKTACRGVPAYKLCKEHTAGLEKYLKHVLSSKTSPETVCRIVGMCNNDKLDAALAVSDLEKKAEPKKHKEHLLGAAQCTWGPSYWCSNFSTGRECKATHHCIERVWSHMQFPEDKDDICKICTDMVTQARDQLQSNETQEELKQVFEGSCDLIPIKLVRKECIKLADDFVPELVETLASQMNPQAVCSVAGLCNNAKIDLMLEDYHKQLALRAGCSSCQQTVTLVRKKFDQTSYDDFLIGLLQMCGKAGSLSDSCSMLVFKYYENILAAVKKDLTPQSMCHLSGQCNHRFHAHDEYTFPVDKQLTDVEDVPCEFCEKLVLHLRDILVANTTEIEFHKIITGLCKQTGEFKAECLSLVEQYGDEIYGYLVAGLKAHELCSMIGICGKNEDVAVAPLLPKELAVKAVTISSSKLIGADEANSYTTEKNHRVQIGDKETNVRILGSDPNVAALPIERMFVAVPRGKQACSFCQYFLHYLQVELSDANTEDAIKSTVARACDKLPSSIDGECRQFVSEYGPAVIALLVQEIDPSSVCPAMGLCPQTQEIARASVNADKSNCPLCLFAIEQLETVIKNNRSEEAIKAALDGLCNHLSDKLRMQCVDFVDSYSKQVIEMVVANMDAQQICVYLKLCTDNVQDPLGLTSSSIDRWFEKSKPADRNVHKGYSLLPKSMQSGQGDIETNEIPDHTVNGRPVKQPTAKTVCVVCEFVMKEIDDEIRDKHNQDEIKKIVHGVCKRMPKSVRADCDQFVEKYADLVISLLSQELDPAEVCRELKLCDETSRLDAVREDILNCAVCETVVVAVKKVLSSEKVDRDVVHVVEKSCGLLPAKYSQRCHTLMEIYGDSVIHLLEQYGTKAVCQKIGLCAAHTARVHLHKH